MVSNFALALSFEGITLLRRMGSSWARIEEVPIDHADLDVAVVAMRDRAEALDPKGAEVALIIPNEQIRYIDLPSLGGDGSARDAAIRAALDGATPYPLNALSWDHVVSGGRLQIAAVAHETLEEAETFARDHGFTPTCHMARADAAQFDGPVFFGKASGWRRSVDRPARPIEIVAADAAALTPVQQVQTVQAPDDLLAEVQPPVVTPAPSAPSIPESAAVSPEPAQFALELPEIALEKPDLSEPEPVVSEGSYDAPAEPAEPTQGEAAARRAHPDEDVAPVPDPEPAFTPEPEDLHAPEPEPEPEPAVSFASTRTARTDGDLPPAPRPLLTETLETTPLKPRFTPLATPEVQDSGEPATDLKPAPRPSPASMYAAPLRDETTGFKADAAPKPRAIPPAPKPPAQSAPAPLSATPPAPASRPVPAATRPTGVPSASGIPPLGAADVTGPTPALGPAVLPDPIADAQTPAPSLGAAMAPPPDAAAPAAPPSGQSVSAAPAKGRRPMRLGLRRKSAKPETTEATPPAPKRTGSAPAIAPRASEAAPLPGNPNPLTRLAALRRPAIAGPAAMTALRNAPAAKPPADLVPDLVPLAPRLDPKPDLIPEVIAPVAPAAKVAAPLSEAPMVAPAKAPALAPETAPLTSPKVPTAKPAVTKSRPAKAAPQDELEKMTVFGARKAQAAPARPRYLGLLLTVLLVLFMLGVGAWSALFTENGFAGLFGSSDDTTVASVETPTPVEDVQLLPPETLPEPGTDTAVPEDVAVATTPEPDPAPVAVIPPAPPEGAYTLTPEEADATYAATGIWQRAPAAPLTPPTDGVDDVYVASIDPSVRELDAVALPVSPNPAAEAILDDPGLPPPAGMTFDIDPRGVVRATPEGALTPDGLRVYAGLPPVIPPLRNAPAAQPAVATPPASQAQPQPETPAAPIEDGAAATGTEVTPAPAPARNNPLQNVRPEARPDDVVEQQERATLRGISRDELAGFRPQRRPQTAQEQAVEEQPAAPATAQAVRNSLEPVGRPRNMEAIVKQAEITPAPEPVQTAAAATVTPRTVQPSVPSSASVAASATVRNAINLNKINLIGVYGTPSNRRALVRLASGKYLKVKVGDKIDGGKVAAIGESELRYVKGGRNVTLQMPRG
ncbi:hypothetical protein [Sagittula sp. S175]|uniref:hypothetical protein n=1 Tax=Sagittula sp. S175 TaxID=3415129 RepID=UPI003C7A99CF